MARIAVIGAGMGGLAAAARLATLGHDVTLFEQTSSYGGKLGVHRRDGFTFDTGPHLLTLPATYRDLFLKTGDALENHVDLLPVDPAFHYRFADGLALEIPNVSRRRIAAAWDDAVGNGAGADWASLLERAGRIWDATRQPFLESPLEGARTLLGQARDVNALRTIAPWRSLRGLGRHYLRDPHQQLVWDRYATYTGSDPRLAPAALAAVGFVEQSFGAWTVRGGLHRLGRAVYERALERGATIRLGERVTSLIVEGGQVTGLRSEDGGRFAADLVIADADARHLYRDLVPQDVGGSARAALRRTTPSLSAFVLLLALRGRTPGLAHHTVLFPEDYDAEFDAVFGRGRYRRTGPRAVDDPAIYISAPDDPELRPDDSHEAWFVQVNAPRHTSEAQRRLGLKDDDRVGGIDWDATGFAEKYADHVLEVLAGRGYDVRERLLWREIRTPADLERRTFSVGGAIYGTSSNGARSAFLRPANRSPVPGLFLVGGSAHPGGGLPLVALSAAIVADLIGPA
jgi:phytoene desaturase